MRPTLSNRQLAALKARIDLTAFCRAVYPPYQHAAHIELITQALAQVARYIETRGQEGIGRLRIELPPRHGKSQLVARLFPAWIMGRIPDLRVILASHGAQLSEGHSRYIRNTIRSASYNSIFPAVRLAEDSQARDAWDMADPYQGGLLAVGTGGSVTGRGAGLIVCDDLVKSREEVESEAAREKLWTWFTDDLLTRQEPHAAIISIGTRWHIDDILGRLELQEGVQWTLIRLPALAEENDPLGREIGEALWPARFSREALEAQRESMGEYSFSALYQQSPIAGAGGVFTREKFKLIDEPPANIVQRVRFWDLALSEKKYADYTVGTLLGLTADKRIVVLAVERLRRSWQGVMNRISEIALADGPDVRIGIESVLFSAAAVTDLLQRPELHDYSIKGIEVHKDKHTRALPFAARVDAGMADVLRRAWTGDWLDELCSFPNGKHDDQVDSAASAYGMLPVTLPREAAFPNFADRHIANLDYDPAQDLYWSIYDGNPRVILVGQVDPAGAIRVLAEHYDVDQPDHAVSIEAVRALGYKAPALAFIPEGAEVLRRYLWTASIYHTRVAPDLEESIKQTRLMLETSRLHIHERCQRLISEIRAADSGLLPSADRSGPLALIQLCYRLRWNTITSTAVDKSKV